MMKLQEGQLARIKAEKDSREAHEAFLKAVQDQLEAKGELETATKRKAEAELLHLDAIKRCRETAKEAKELRAKADELYPGL